MTRIFSVILSLWALPAMAQQAIEDVIGNQLSAFNDRDVTEAWQYAAPNIQGMFGNPQNFAMMVERGYPMVWTNSDVEFLDTETVGGMTLQRLRLQDTAGGFHFLEYQMVETANGWRIAGVRVLEAPDVGV